MSDVFSEQVLTTTRGHRLLKEPVHLFVNSENFPIPCPYPPHTAALAQGFVQPDGVGEKVAFSSLYETSMVTRRAFNDWLCKGKGLFYTALIYTLLHEHGSVHRVSAVRFATLAEYYTAQNHLVESYLKAQIDDYPLVRL